MRHSLNEVENIVCRASLGAGWSYGLAAEAGRAASWLCAHGYDGAAAALKALGSRPRSASATRSAAGWRFQGQPVIAAGLSAFDLLETDRSAEVLMDQLDSPGLLIGYAGRAAEIYRTVYHAMIADRTLEVSATRVTHAPNLDELSGEWRITRRHAGSVSSLAMPVERIDSLADVWGALDRLAAKSYVPTTEDSRARGAGAGQTDND